MREAPQWRAQTHARPAPALQALEVKDNIDHRRRCTAAERHVKNTLSLGDTLPSPPMESHLGVITPVPRPGLSIIARSAFRGPIPRKFADFGFGRNQHGIKGLPIPSTGPRAGSHSRPPGCPRRSTFAAARATTPARSPDNTLPCALSPDHNIDREA